MIWSIIPEEIIFQDLKENNTIKKINYLNRDILVGMTEDGKKRIVSVLSTDPLDYLDQRLSPGTIIDADQEPSGN